MEVEEGVKYLSPNIVYREVLLSFIIKQQIRSDDLQRATNKQTDPDNFFQKSYHYIHDGGLVISRRSSSFLSKGAIHPWAGGCGRKAQQSPGEESLFSPP